MSTQIVRKFKKGFLPSGIWRGLHVVFEGSLGNFQKRICGLTEPLLRIQLVAEGSSSTWRAFGVAMAKVRYHFVEGSAFQ